MNITLSIASLALAALAVFLSRRQSASPAPPAAAGLVVLLGLTAVLIVASIFGGAVSDPLSISASLLLGGVGGALAAWTGARGIAGLAIGVAVGVISVFFPEARFACLVTLGVATLVLMSEAAAYASIGAAVTLAGDALGPRAGDSAVLASTGSLLALGAVLAGLVALAFSGLGKDWLRPLLAGALTIAIGAFLLNGYLKLPDYQLVVVTAGLAALVVHWLVLDSTDSLRLGLATLIWIGLGIVSFGIGQGLGICLAVLVAASVTAGLSNVPAMLTMSPLLGLALYRVLRDAHPVAPPALEATQYNALIGLSIGVVLPLLPIDWFSEERPAARQVMGAALWAVLLLIVPAAALIAAGPRGVVGLVIGLGLAGLLVSLRTTRSLVSYGIFAAVSGTIIMTYPWFRPLLLIERDEKVRILAMLAVLIAALGFALAAASARPASPKEVAS